MREGVSMGLGVGRATPDTHADALFCKPRAQRQGSQGSDGEIDAKSQHPRARSLRQTQAHPLLQLILCSIPLFSMNMQLVGWFENSIWAKYCVLNVWPELPQSFLGILSIERCTFFLFSHGESRQQILALCMLLANDRNVLPALLHGMVI